MLRLINIGLLVSLVAFASVMYQVKYEARGVDAQLARLTAAIEREQEAIAVLRAEWSLLNRPERIERLAREHLSLDYVGAKQLVSLDALNQIMTPAAQTQQAAAPPAKSTHTASLRRPAR